MTGFIIYIIVLALDLTLMTILFDMIWRQDDDTNN